MCNIKILIVGGPVEKYIDRCLNSISTQHYNKWEAQIVLDPYGDKSEEFALKWVSDKIHLQVNNRRMFAIPNLLRAAELLKPKDNDILITVDADDWLLDDNALDIIVRYYRAFPNLLLTHGSWVPFPFAPCNTNNAPYDKMHFETNIRKYDWRASHLRTFKYILWKNIKDKDLKDQNGNYFQSAWDLALMWPMLEMAGYERVKFVPELLYVYNMENPASDTRLRIHQQMYYSNYIAAKKPYGPLKI
jgi:glycosyltransferase involved in cell wall biosynthesis